MKNGPEVYLPKKKMLNIVNRNSYPCFQPSPIVPYKVKKRITAVRLKMISHDEEYAKKKKNHEFVIDITNPEIYVDGKKPVDGIFSPYFGADTTQDTPVYSCDCHNLIGGSNLGKICPRCGTECRSIEADLSVNGYIDIAPYHILSYHGYKALSKVCKNFDTIINTTNKIDSKGKIKDDGIPSLMDMYEDYDEVWYPKTGLEKKYAWTSKIPVYSSRLRPLMHYGMSMSMLEVNKAYLSILECRNVLKATSMVKFQRTTEIQKTLNQMQRDFIVVFGEIENQINGKSGVFRKSLASGRIDYSSRMVITLGPDLMPHEIDVPYQTMMVLYEEEIANHLSKMENITISKAISLVQDNQMFRNEKFVKIINRFLREGRGVWALIGRNPTISESGIMYVRIRAIHDDPTDYTLHLPSDILALMGADFD